MKWTKKEKLFIDKLNSILREKEKIIVHKVKEYIRQMEEKTATDAFTNDFEVYVEVAYFAKDAGDPFYTYEPSFIYSEIDNDKGFTLLNDGEDWSEGRFPFTEPCCYLMHNLWLDSPYSNLVCTIHSIWIDIHIKDQNIFSVENKLPRRKTRSIRKLNIGTTRTEDSSELYKEANKGNEEAVQQLLLLHLQDVVQTARQVFKPGITVEELMTAGINALRRYFKIYKNADKLTWVIRQSMLQELEEKDLLPKPFED